MTDKKFTDDEIILGLKCLAGEDEIFCKDCAFRDMDRRFACKKNVSKASLDLINRQKAEIEKLKEAYAVYEETTGLKQVRNDSIKKFADLLKATGGLYGEIWESDIDRVLKVMEGKP
jgi:hypothetical protein